MGFQVTFILISVLHVGLAANESAEAKASAYNQMKDLCRGKNPLYVMKQLHELYNISIENKQQVENLVDRLAVNESVEAKAAAYEQLKELCNSNNRLDEMKRIRQVRGKKDIVEELSWHKQMAGIYAGLDEPVTTEPSPSVYGKLKNKLKKLIKSMNSVGTRLK